MLHWFAKRMTEASREARKDERGFTLIELLVVVIIIGILAAIAIPTFLSQRASAQDNAAKANLRNAATAEQAFYAQNNRYGKQADLAALRNLGFPGADAEPQVTIKDASTNASGFCVEATSGATNKFHVTQSTGAPATGACP